MSFWCHRGTLQRLKPLNKHMIFKGFCYVSQVPCRTTFEPVLTASLQDASKELQSIPESPSGAAKDPPQILEVDPSI